MKNDHDGRRKWVVDGPIKKKDENEETAEDFIPHEKTDYLQSRKFDLELKKNLGDNYILAKGGADVNKKRIFYCETCDCTFNDSSTYVDHTNGKKRIFKKRIQSK